MVFPELTKSGARAGAQDVDGVAAPPAVDGGRGRRAGVPVTVTVALPAMAVSSSRDVRLWPEKLATVSPATLTVLLVIAYVVPELPLVSSIVMPRCSFPCSC